MGFTRAELESFRGCSIPDFMPERPRLIFVGINPGLWTAATGVPFAHPGNRFYPALVLPAALLGWQVLRLDIHDPALCLRLFRANREAGLAVGLAILAGWV